MYLRDFLLRVSFLLVLSVLAGCQTVQSVDNKPLRDTATTEDRPVTLVYLRAANCHYCLSWERNVEPKWLASAERGKVSYRALSFATFKDLTTDNVWPDDLKWIREELNVRKGTPRWVLVRDREVLAKAFGSNHWGDIMMPAIQRAVGPQ